MNAVRIMVLLWRMIIVFMGLIVRITLVSKGVLRMRMRMTKKYDVIALF